jgi:hypothetical protein
MPRRPITADRYTIRDHPISTVLKALAETGRSITRSNFHESRRRKLLHPTSKGKGRHGDGYDIVAICQAGLYFDLTQKLHLHQERCSEIAYSPETKQFLKETVEFCQASRHRVGGNAFALPASAVQSGWKQMDIAFFWSLEWGIEVEYLRGAEDLLRFHAKRRFARMALVVNVSQLAWEILDAIEKIA